MSTAPLAWPPRRADLPPTQSQSTGLPPPEDMPVHPLAPAELRQWREARGWTTAEAAAWYGCSQRAWQRYEDGTRHIPRPLLVKIARGRWADR